MLDPDLIDFFEHASQLEHLYFRLFDENILYIRYDKNFHELGSVDAYRAHFKSGVYPILNFLPKKIICSVGLEETCNPDDVVYCVQAVNHLLAKLQKSGIIDNYVVIVNDNHCPTVREQLVDLPNVMFFYWFLMVYNYYYPHSFSWNSTSKKFLYLPGNPRRHHRIYSMYKMHKEKLIQEKLSYTWSGDLCNLKDADPKWYPDIYRLLKEMVPDLSIQLPQFMDLIHSWDQDQDDATIVGRQIGRYMMHPVSEELYNTGCCELIAETWIGNTYHLTEKTWRAIFAGQPFIPMETDFINSQLEHMGFRTFKHYVDTDTLLKMPNRNEGYLPYVKQCVDHSIMLAEKFVDVCKDPAIEESIRSDIEHNRHVINTYVHNVITELEHKISGFHIIAKDFFTQNGP